MLTIAGNEEVVQHYYNKMYDGSKADRDKIIVETVDFQVTQFDYLYSKYFTEMFNELGNNTKKTSDKKNINQLNQFHNALA